MIAFNDWMDEPRLAAGRQASILFDYRRSAGPLEAERTFAEVIGSSPHRPRFLRQMARQAVDARPPARVDGRLVDVKDDGLTPIVNLARSYALECGVGQPRTLERLELAAARGRIDDETWEGLTEAFRLLADPPRTPRGLRPRGARTERQHRPANARAPNAVELAEAFRFVRRAQRSARREHRLPMRFRRARSGSLAWMRRTHPRDERR